MYHDTFHLIGHQLGMVFTGRHTGPLTSKLNLCLAPFGSWDVKLQDTIWRGDDLMCFSIYQRPNVRWSLDVRGHWNHHQNQRADIFRAFFEHGKRTAHTHKKIHLKLVKWPITATEHAVTHKLASEGTQLLEHLIRFWLKCFVSVKICTAPWCSDKNMLVFPLTLWWLASVSCLGLSFATSFLVCLCVCPCMCFYW